MKNTEYERLMRAAEAVAINIKAATTSMEMSFNTIGCMEGCFPDCLSKDQQVILNELDLLLNKAESCIRKYKHSLNDSVKKWNLTSIKEIKDESVFRETLFFGNLSAGLLARAIEIYGERYEYWQIESTLLTLLDHEDPVVREATIYTIGDHSHSIHTKSIIKLQSVAHSAKTAGVKDAAICTLLELQGKGFNE